MMKVEHLIKHEPFCGTYQEHNGQNPIDREEKLSISVMMKNNDEAASSDGYQKQTLSSCGTFS